MKHCLIALLLCALLLLVGCAAEPATEPTPEPAVTAPAPEPEPEPLPEMTDGGAVTVNGQPLHDGCWLIDGVRYVRLWALTQALDTDLTLDGETVCFTWLTAEVTLTAGSDEIQWGDETLRLDAPVHSILEDVYVPLESLCDALYLGRYEDTEQAMLYVTPGAGKFDVPVGYSVPTLMYHAVSDYTWGETDLFVSPSELEKQLQYLLDNGYTPIHFSDLAYVDQIEKPVLLTFDDGYLDNYTELFPLLQQYGVKATVFVITDSIGTHDKYMTWEQAKEMADSGLVSIQSHTLNHPFLAGLSYDDQVTQLEQSKLIILRQTGYEPYVLCYPNGSYNQDTLDAAARYYSFGLKMVGDAYYTDENVYEINRWFVSRFTTLDRFAQMLEG